jgi:VWFA-related protein
VRNLASVALALTGLFLQAQTPPSELPVPTIRANTRMIVINVVATDKAGAVTDLTADDFSVTEDGNPQKLSAFGFEKPALSEQTGAEPLPPNVYTNRPSYLRPSGPLTILLLDSLNTQVQDQIYFRRELLRYVKNQVRPGQRLAVFVLGEELHMLQDFTSDPELLRRAVENYTAKESLELAQDVLIAAPAPREPKGSAGYLQTLRMLKELGADHGEITANQRVAGMLAAFRTIARSVAGYSGRKNLVWVSGSFPLTYQVQRGLLVDQNASNSEISFYRSYQREIRQTANIMGDAQIAIYPVDARGLPGAESVDASQSMTDELGHSYTGPALAEVVTRSSNERLNAEASMKEVAGLTGGKAFVNRDDIENAVALSVEDGSSYYTLAYYPSKKAWHGEFRKISVKVARKGVQLRYRNGYFATDAGQELQTRDVELVQALRSDAPPATMVIFDARVLPARLELPESAYATRKYLIDFMVDPRTLSSEVLPDGGHHFNLEFHAVAFASDGTLVAHQDAQLNRWASPASYEWTLVDGLPLHTSLELGAGTYHLRLVVRDIRTGYLGTVDVPLVVEQPAMPNL